MSKPKIIPDELTINKSIQRKSGLTEVETTARIYILAMTVVIY